ncbi:hypothetical protein V6N13_001838 [Hibiscus sabdariffa]|uniref:Uncharacterized protein n=1 Tax=Hibiscus sabdariffa TaxID=183260 RepID=A0ABR2GA78_9ROSI
MCRSTRVVASSNVIYFNNGRTEFVSGSKLPHPAEKHNETLISAGDQAQIEHPDSDADFDSLELDLPEVPKVSFSATRKNEMSNDLVGVKNKQILPFVSPPSISTRPSNPPPAISTPKSEANEDLQDVSAVAQATSETAELTAAAACSAASLAQDKFVKLAQGRDELVTESSSPEDPFSDHAGALNYRVHQERVHQGSEAADLSSVNKQKRGFDSPVSVEQNHLQHQSQRLSSVWMANSSHIQTFSRDRI